VAEVKGTSPRSLRTNRTPTMHNNKEMSCRAGTGTGTGNPNHRSLQIRAGSDQTLPTEEGFTVIG
jgi:hypothetical protein